MTNETEKTFNMSWYESVRYTLDIKAKNEKEAEDKFFSGDYDLTEAEIQDGSLEDGSLVITELKE